MGWASLTSEHLPTFLSGFSRILASSYHCPSSQNIKVFWLPTFDPALTPGSAVGRPLGLSSFRAVLKGKKKAVPKRCENKCHTLAGKSKKSVHPQKRHFTLNHFRPEGPKPIMCAIVRLVFIYSRNLPFCFTFVFWNTFPDGETRGRQTLNVSCIPFPT